MKETLYLLFLRYFHYQLKYYLVLNFFLIKKNYKKLTNGLIYSGINFGSKMTQNPSQLKKLSESILEN